MTQWTCQCTAINEALSRTCWRCKTQRPQTSAIESLEATAKSELTIRDLLLPYLGEAIAVNYSAPTKLEEAVLVAVHTDSFAVSARGSTNRHHIPFRYILSMVENADKSLLQVEIYRQVFIRGAVSIGWSMPI